MVEYTIVPEFDDAPVFFEVPYLVLAINELEKLGYKTHIKNADKLAKAGCAAAILESDKPFDETARRIIETYEFRVQ